MVGVTALQAIKRDAGLRLPLARSGSGAYIHSVFRSTVNICGEEGELLLTLAVPSTVMAPGMAVINRESDFRVLCTNIKPGKQIRIDGKIIYLSDSLVCHWGGAALVSLAIPLALSAAPVRTAAELTAILRRWAKPGGAGRPWLLCAGCAVQLETLHERALYAKLTLLDLLMRTGKEEQLYEAMGGIVGLGIGLTPSADDFLAGFFGVLFAARPAFREWAAVHGDVWLSRVKGQTTFLAGEMLKRTLAGEANEAALGVMRVCFGNEKKSLEEVAQRLMALGSTSGTDMLAGMAFGLETLDVWKRRGNHANENSDSKQCLS